MEPLLTASRHAKPLLNESASAHPPPRVGIDNKPDDFEYVKIAA